MINRSAVIVRPKKAYLDWVAQLDNSGVSPDMEQDKTVYLIPEYDDEVEAMNLLAEVYETIFETELCDWHTRDSDWPKNRTFQMFQEWFKIELNSVVEDLCDSELRQED